jgi:accessory gene regulator B
MNYDKLVQSISSYIAQELNLTASKQDRIRFGLELLISALISLAVALLVAWLLGVFKPVIIILATVSLLKLSSGGVHLKTIWECAVWGGLLVNLLGLFSLAIKPVVLNNWLVFFTAVSIYSLSSLLLWSPAAADKKPLEDSNHNKKLKLVSLSLTGTLLALIFTLFYLYQERFILINTSIMLGVLFQTSAINPVAYKARDLYYKIKPKVTN